VNSTQKKLGRVSDQAESALTRGIRMVCVSASVGGGTGFVGLAILNALLETAALGGEVFVSGYVAGIGSGGEGGSGAVEAAMVPSRRKDAVLEAVCPSWVMTVLIWSCRAEDVALDGPR